MEMDRLQQIALTVIEWSALTLLFLVGLSVIAVIVVYIIDKTQTQQAIRRNYPVVGRFRYFFEHLGEFFRQYFFAMDREELPFNRAERAWAYRAAKQVDTTIAFGSTRSMTLEGEPIFLNSAFPTLAQHGVEPRPITIGDGYCEQPYTTKAILNISGMSFGAISKPAVRALSNGAKAAGIWMNTGEGGLSPYHLEGGCDIVFQIGTAKYGVRDDKGELCDLDGNKLSCSGKGPDPMKTFEARTAKELTVMIFERWDKAKELVTVGHAAYVGREAQRAERCLLAGEFYQQD